MNQWLREKALTKFESEIRALAVKFERYGMPSSTQMARKRDEDDLSKSVNTGDSPLHTAMFKPILSRLSGPKFPTATTGFGPLHSKRQRPERVPPVLLQSRVGSVPYRFPPPKKVSAVPSRSQYKPDGSQHTNIA